MPDIDAIATARAEGFRAGLERAAEVCRSRTRDRCNCDACAELRSVAGVIIRALAPVPDSHEEPEVTKLQRALQSCDEYAGVALAKLGGEFPNPQTVPEGVKAAEQMLRCIEKVKRAAMDPPATGATLPPTETTR